jgi:hypothetical protein
MQNEAVRHTASFFCEKIPAAFWLRELIFVAISRSFPSERPCG